MSGVRNMHEKTMKMKRHIKKNLTWNSAQPPTLNNAQNVPQGLFRLDSHDILVRSDVEVIDGVVEKTPLFTKVCHEVFEDRGISDARKHAGCECGRKYVVELLAL